MHDLVEALLLLAAVAWGAAAVERGRRMQAVALAHAARTEGLLLRAEQLWRQRRTESLAWQDDAGEVVTAQILGDIVRARAELAEWARENRVITEVSDE